VEAKKLMEEDLKKDRVAAKSVKKAAGGGLPRKSFAGTWKKEARSFRERGIKKRPRLSFLKS